MPQPVEPGITDLLAVTHVLLLWVIGNMDSRLQQNKPLDWVVAEYQPIPNKLAHDHQELLETLAASH